MYHPLIIRVKGRLFAAGAALDEILRERLDTTGSAELHIGEISKENGSLLEGQKMVSQCTKVQGVFRKEERMTREDYVVYSTETECLWTEIRSALASEL